MRHRSRPELTTRIRTGRIPHLHTPIQTRIIHLLTHHTRADTGSPVGSRTIRNRPGCQGLASCRFLSGEVLRPHTKL